MLGDQAVVYLRCRAKPAATAGTGVDRLVGFCRQRRSAADRLSLIKPPALRGVSEDIFVVQISAATGIAPKPKGTVRETPAARHMMTPGPHNKCRIPVLGKLSGIGQSSPPHRSSVVSLTHRG